MIHDCPDCLIHGGIGFLCNHMYESEIVVDVYLIISDDCDWCAEQGFSPGMTLSVLGHYPPNDFRKLGSQMLEEYNTGKGPMHDG